MSTYDLLGRLKTQVTPVEVGDSTVTYTRNGLSTATLDGQSHTTTRNSNPDGTLKEVVNALHKTTAYAYNPFGELTGIQDSGGNSTAMTYDARGFQRTLDDPDSSGLWVTEYTAFGEVWRTRDPKTASSAWTMVMTYDQLGRQTKRQEAEGDTTWVYYPTNVGTDRRKGLLNHVTGPLAGSSTAFQQTYLYNGQAQVRQTLSTIAGKNFQTDMTYNQGQLSTMIYPLSVSGNRHSFSWQYRNGITSRLDATDGGINTTIWTLAASDPLGRAQHVKFGPGTMITDEQRGLDPRSLRLTGIQTGQALGTGIQNYGYTWDKAGNLTKRQNLAAGGKTEVFAYDVLNRLDTVTLNTTQTLNVDYDDGVGGTPGNIQYKSDYGTYTYGQWGAGPRAVTSVSGPESMTYHYDVNGNMDCRGWNATALSCTPAATADEIQWTSFNLPKRIERQSAYSTLDYGPDRQVIRQIRAAPGLGFRNITTVGPHFEYEVSGASVTRWRHTAYVDGQAVYLQVDEEIPGGHAGSEINYYAYYVHHDHQGSWDELTPAWGSAGKVSYSFDAFGKRREPDWTADVDNSQQFGTEHMSRKGYTGHEHLDHLGMIHMRGRVQEPILGRMISRDPLLGDIGNPETLNRYAYVVNNPATLTDPTGFGPCTADCFVVYDAASGGREVTVTVRIGGTVVGSFTYKTEGGGGSGSSFGGTGRDASGMEEVTAGYRELSVGPGLFGGGYLLKGLSSAGETLSGGPQNGPVVGTSNPTGGTRPGVDSERNSCPPGPLTCQGSGEFAGVGYKNGTKYGWYTCGNRVGSCRFIGPGVGDTLRKVVTATRVTQQGGPVGAPFYGTVDYPIAYEPFRIDRNSVWDNIFRRDFLEALKRNFQSPEEAGLE